MRALRRLLLPVLLPILLVARADAQADKSVKSEKAVPTAPSGAIRIYVVPKPVCVCMRKAGQ